MSTFNVQTYQNEHLPTGATAVHAILAVSASGPAILAPEAAEVIVIDVSASMAGPKLAAAKQAAAAAIDCLRDGVAFAVIAGAQAPYQLYPPQAGLAAATTSARDEAKQALAALQPLGGTAIGAWLRLAAATLTERPDAIRHAILVTDGHNGESAKTLEAALGECEGQFQCDCRGVGTDWKVSELRQIASALLGTHDIIADPAGLAADFQAMMEGSMARHTSDVWLRVWAPRIARVELCKQMAPVIEDLTARARVIDERTVEYPTGAWGEETREYHLAIAVPERAAGEQMLAARVNIVVDGTPAADAALVKATWTDDERLSARINHELARHTGQAELAAAIQDGIEALDAGDGDQATRRLGAAVQLAAESGNDAALRLLDGVVIIDNAASGSVQLRRHVERSDAMALEARSIRTVLVSRPAP